MAVKFQIGCKYYSFTLISTFPKTGFTSKNSEKGKQKLINEHSQSCLSKLISISNAQLFCWQKHFYKKCQSDTQKLNIIILCI